MVHVIQLLTLVLHEFYLAETTVCIANVGVFRRSEFAVERSSSSFAFKNIKNVCFYEHVSMVSYTHASVCGVILSIMDITIYNIIQAGISNCIGIVIKGAKEATIIPLTKVSKRYTRLLQ